MQISMALWKRSATGLTFPALSSPRPPLGDRPHGSRQGVTPCTPHRAHGARGVREKAGWLRSYRRSATGLAARRFGVVSCQLAGTDRHSTKGLVACAKGQRELETPSGLLPCEISRPTLKHPNWRWLTCSSTQAAAKQSGDRQRREKGTPILTAEKGEHERAPRAGESCPIPLRATLRAPPSKWAIKGFFPEG